MATAALQAELHFLPRYLRQNREAVLDTQAFALALTQLRAVAHEVPPGRMQQDVGISVRGIVQDPRQRCYARNPWRLVHDIFLVAQRGLWPLPNHTPTQHAPYW